MRGLVVRLVGRVFVAGLVLWLVVAKALSFSRPVIASVVAAVLRRSDAMERVAREMGFRFERKPASLPNLGFFRLTFFHKASSTFKNILRGTTGSVEALVFDYDYWEELDLGQGRWHMQTVAALRFSGAMLPHFELSPENLGYRQIDFESHPAFSKKFRVQGEDESAVRALFQPPVLAFFEAMEKEQRWTMECRGEWLIVYRDDCRVKPTELRVFLSEASAAAEVFIRAAATNHTCS